MTNTNTPHDNLGFYSKPDVVQLYREANYLSAAEQHLFGAWLGSGMRILDLGVGGGRTSEYLAKGAAEYVGIDYAPDMVEVCRKRFPGLDFRTMDAADLSAFADGHFDAVVFSFNGLGCLYPDDARLRCLRECQRVLKPGGIFIFSLHYAGSLLFRYPSGQGLRQVASWALNSGKRFFQRVFLPQFWRGEGYFVNKAIGTVIHLTTPARVQRMLADAGFSLLEVLGDDYPLKNIPLMTRWYYYAARK